MNIKSLADLHAAKIDEAFLRNAGIDPEIHAGFLQYMKNSGVLLETDMFIKFNPASTRAAEDAAQEQWERRPPRGAN